MRTQGALTPRRPSIRADPQGMHAQTTVPVSADLSGPRSDQAAQQETARYVVTAMCRRPATGVARPGRVGRQPGRSSDPARVSGQ